MKKLRLILLHILLFPLHIVLMDTTWEGGAPPEPDPDGWVRMMNKFMPLKGEILLIGIKGTFQEIKILENFGRDERVVQFEEIDECDLWTYSHNIADRYPDPHVMVCDVFSGSVHPFPIMPDGVDRITLTVSTEDGELGVADVIRGASSNGCEDSSAFMKTEEYPGYDQYLVAKVIGHNWPD